MRRWPFGLITVLVIAIAVAIGVGSQRPAPLAASPSPTLAAVLPAPSPFPEPSRPASSPLASPSLTTAPATLTPPPSLTPTQTPTITPEPTPSQSPDPLGSPTGLRWEIALGPPQLPGTFRVDPPIAWAKGFATVSYGRGKATEVWLSQDGRDWSPQDLPFDPKMTNTSVLPLRESLALVDMYGSLGGWAFDVWTSKDGAHWKRGTSIEALPERPDDQVGATAMSFGDRIAVTATIGPGLCCGLGVRPGGAATATALDSSGLAGSSGRDVRMRAWTTRDGLSWHPNRVRGLGGSTLPAWPHVGTDAFAFRSHGAALHLSRTTDGVNWTDIGALPEDVGPYNVVDAIAIPHGYVLAADTAGFRGITSGSALTIYTSPDGRTWTERLYRIGWQVDALVGVGSTVLLVGHESSEVPDGERPLALVSSDDGATWELSAGWPGMESGCFLGLALRDRLANASIGCSDGIPQILVAELP